MTSHASVQRAAASPQATGDVHSSASSGDTAAATAATDVYTKSGERPTAPTGLVRGLTEPVRRLIPGHKARHELRQGLHEQIFAALELSATRDAGAAKAWQGVIKTAEDNGLSLTKQLRRCTRDKHPLELVLDAGDYHSLRCFMRHLPSGTFGKILLEESDYSYYIGEWRKGFDGSPWPHGLGTEKNYENGMFEVYQGGWLDGKFHGKGLIANEYYKHEGEFERGRAHGPGKREQNGRITTGTWREGKLHGEATWERSSGFRGMGTWHSGRLDRAELTWPNGSCYEGEMDDYEPKGPGKLTRSDGTTIRAQFAVHMDDQGKGLVCAEGDGVMEYGRENELWGYRLASPFVHSKPHGAGVFQNMTTKEATPCYHVHGELIGQVPPPLHGESANHLASGTDVR